MQTLGDATLIYALVNVSIRIAIWVLPVFLYLRFVDKVNVIDYLKLRQYWKRGIFIGILFGLVNLSGTALRFGIPHLSARYVTWNSIIGTSILIGFIEEIPFRGFILQKFQERMNFWMANIVSSLLFLGIHLPGWIKLHLLSVGTAVTIFVFGAIMSILVHYSKSLWSSTIAHSLNDFLSFVIFHI